MRCVFRHFLKISRDLADLGEFKWSFNQWETVKVQKSEPQAFGGNADFAIMVLWVGSCRSRSCSLCIRVSNLIWATTGSQWCKERLKVQLFVELNGDGVGIFGVAGKAGSSSRLSLKGSVFIQTMTRQSKVCAATLFALIPMHYLTPNRHTKVKAPIPFNMHWYRFSVKYMSNR